MLFFGNFMIDNVLNLGCFFCWNLLDVFWNLRLWNIVDLGINGLDIWMGSNSTFDISLEVCSNIVKLSNLKKGNDESAGKTTLA